MLQYVDGFTCAVNQNRDALSIQFVQHDVDIVRPDAVRERGDAFSFVCPGDGVKLAAGDFAFFRVEKRRNGIDPLRVADEDDAVSQLFGFQMQMETASICIDDEF